MEVTQSSMRMMQLCSGSPSPHRSSHHRLVRFPNPLALGSGLGLHYPYRRGIFLSPLPALTIGPEHSWQGAYWISRCLSLPHDQSQLDFTHWSRRQHSISILHQFATFAGAICFRCISHFQLPYFFRLPFCICFAIKITGSQILQVT